MNLQNVTLAETWRGRARRLDDYARRMRRDGDTVEAQDAERAAVDYRIAADELEAKSVELVDSLTGHATPVWADEGGAVGVRLACGLAGAAALILVVWLVWPYLVGASVIVVAWRVVTRHTRRPRPRSSWSSLGRTAALMFAAWNSRWLKPVTNPARVSVHESVGRQHVDEDGVPY